PKGCALFTSWGGSRPGIWCERPPRRDRSGRCSSRPEARYRRATEAAMADRHEALAPVPAGRRSAPPQRARARARSPERQRLLRREARTRGAARQPPARVRVLVRRSPRGAHLPLGLAPERVAGREQPRQHLARGGGARAPPPAWIALRRRRRGDLHGV